MAGLTDAQSAELLVAGIRVAGLDVDDELERVDALTGQPRVEAIQGYQLLALTGRVCELPAIEE